MYVYIYIYIYIYTHTHPGGLPPAAAGATEMYVCMHVCIYLPPLTIKYSLPLLLLLNNIIIMILHIIMTITIAITINILLLLPPPLTMKYCWDWFTPPNAKLERGSASTSVLVPLG